MSSIITYQGSKTGNLLELHYFDCDGPIWVYLPKEGLDHMCGRSLSDEEVEKVLPTSEKELRPLIDRAFDQCRGKYFRKLNISMADVKDSGIKLSVDVLPALRSAQR